MVADKVGRPLGYALGGQRGCIAQLHRKVNKRSIAER